MNEANDFKCFVLVCLTLLTVHPTPYGYANVLFRPQP